MQRGFWRIPLVMFVALAVVALAVASCGDGDDGGGALTLEQFYQRLEALGDEREADSAELEEQVEELADDASVEDVADNVRRQIDLIENFVNGLDELEPPDEVAAIHREAVDAGRESVEVLRNLLEEAQGAETLDDFFSGLFTPELDEAFNRIAQACLEAEQLAADNGITVDLDCEDE